MDLRTRSLLGERLVGERGEHPVVGVDLRVAGAERDPHVDHGQTVGPRRGGGSVDGAEELLGVTDDPLHDRSLDVHDQQRGVGHTSILLSRHLRRQRTVAVT